MTTENVAILFTDVVGSTELSQRLSAEVADEVRRRHFSILRQAIAEVGGTEVKNLGDGLMVVFSSASGALSCAVAMQQGVERDNRGRDHSVSVRVGLSGGEVSREDDDYFGDPVIEAARLCASCASGQILAAEWVRLTAGRRSRHECRSLGELTLKGLPDPVETVEVVWEPLGRSDSGTSTPLPGRLAVPPAVGVLVGRGAEMAIMSEAFKRVAEGEGREMVLVSGEAGLGKTTLVAEVARTAFDDGACVLFGHCEEELEKPYQLFAEALSHCVTHVPEEQLVAHVETHGSELARLVPALASRIPGLPPSNATDADTERTLLFGAVVGLLATASKHRPVVLVLEDLQWADKESLELLRHVLGVRQPMRVLLLGTHRDSESSPTGPQTDALAALRGQPGVSCIALAGLDTAEIVTYFEAAAGHAVDTPGLRLAEAVYRETSGNPFFVIELLRHLAETGAIYRDGNRRWISDMSADDVAFPDSVREVIGARVTRLGERVRWVLSLAAVIGRDFDVDLLARATTTSTDELLLLVDEATHASLVHELAETPGRYSFEHALIQRTLDEDLGPIRRARANRLVAEALDDLYGDRSGVRFEQLARHWASATATSIDAVVQRVREERSDLGSVSAPDGTVTVVLGDIEASTVLLERLGDTEFLRMLSWHDRIVREAADEHRGLVVKSQDDGFMLAFPSAASALNASLGIRDRVAAGFAGLPIRARAGLHAGEAIRDDDDFHRRTIATAAETSALALGGEVLTSELVYTLTNELRTFTFGEPRAVDLRGIDNALTLYPVLASLNES